jgi:hypothetical protein
MKTELKKSNSKANGYKKEAAIRSVRRAAEILDCISNSISSVTDIAEKCGTP